MVEIVVTLISVEGGTVACDALQNIGASTLPQAGAETAHREHMVDWGCRRCWWRGRTGNSGTAVGAVRAQRTRVIQRTMPSIITDAICGIVTHIATARL
eukprot:7043951-Prymnesium_polylepis.1